MLITGPSIEGIAPAAPDAAPATSGTGNGASFSSTVADAIANADQAQTAASGEASKLANGGGNLHEAALSLEKADISMRLLVKARNKIVEAYQEVMRTPV